MPVATIAKAGQSKQTGEQNSTIVKWVVDGTTDPDIAHSTLLAASPLLNSGLTRLGVRVDETDCETHWDGAVTYGPSNDQDGADPTFTMDISTTTTHIQQSLQTISKYATGGRTPTNTKRVIGGKADGTVDGVDKLIAQASWTETHFLPSSRISRAYFNLVCLTAATMNAGVFRTFNPGEVMLIGGTLTKRASAKDWECQFKFLPLPNATGLTVGDITGISKIGHDYLWVRYNQALDTSSVRIQPIPYEVFVERIYIMTDYDQLRLPDPF